jgi:hypothetical protein
MGRMRRGSRVTLYIAAVAMCVMGVLLTVVSDVWSGRAPFLSTPTPSTDADSSRQLSLAQAQTDERLGGSIIQADTGIFWVTRYTLCGHEKVRESAPDPAMVGKTYAEFAANYPNYTMDTSNGVVRMIRSYRQYCPEHYVIKSDDDGSIYVYRNVEGYDKLTVVMKMAFTVDAVPADYRPLLREGMAFGSVEEIEGLIEDAET